MASARQLTRFIVRDEWRRAENFLCEEHSGGGDTDELVARLLPAVDKIATDYWYALFGASRHACGSLVSLLLRLEASSGASKLAREDLHDACCVAAQAGSLSLVRTLAQHPLFEASAQLVRLCVQTGDAELAAFVLRHRSMPTSGASLRRYAPALGDWVFSHAGESVAQFLALRRLLLEKGVPAIDTNQFSLRAALEARKWGIAQLLLREGNLACPIEALIGVLNVDGGPCAPALLECCRRALHTSVRNCSACSSHKHGLFFPSRSQRRFDHREVLVLDALHDRNSALVQLWLDAAHRGELRVDIATLVDEAVRGGAAHVLDIAHFSRTVSDFGAAVSDVLCVAMKAAAAFGHDAALQRIFGKMSLCGAFDMDVLQHQFAEGAQMAAIFGHVNALRALLTCPMLVDLLLRVPQPSTFETLFRAATSARASHRSDPFARNETSGAAVDDTLAVIVNCLLELRHNEHDFLFDVLRLLTLTTTDGIVVAQRVAWVRCVDLCMAMRPLLLHLGGAYTIRRILRNLPSLGFVSAKHTLEIAQRTMEKQLD